MSNDAWFALVAMGYILGAFALMALIDAICDIIESAVERRRRKKYRNNYVRFK